MRLWLTTALQLSVMAAVVATLAYIPLCLLLAVVVPLFGFSFDALLTFGGALHTVLGLAAWWLIVFVAVFGYSAWLYPWESVR